MIKLSKAELQFIENYLENSDVIYWDIRSEMTDHIASAIEEKMQTEKQPDFYSSFKNYMLANKAALLVNNKKFIKAADTSILKQFGLECIKLSTLFILGLSFLLSINWMVSIEIEDLRSHLSGVSIISIVPFCIIYVIAITYFKIPRFSGLERLSVLYMICFQLFNFFNSIMGLYIQDKTNFYGVALVLSVMITISILLIKMTLKIVNQYRCYQLHINL